MPLWIRHLLKVLAIFTAGLTSQVMASIVINGTRVIYYSDAKEVSVKINNVGKQPILFQSWIDNGNADARPESIQVPFVLTPPINRIDADKGQTLRISYSGSNLPTDRETCFWLNVLEIPASKPANKASGDYLQMAFRTRIKLFWRPVGLKGSADDAAKALNWTSVNNTLQANNPSPYYVSLSSVAVNGKRAEGDMIAPYASLKFALPANAGDHVSANYVNDYGAINRFEQPIN